MIDPNALADQHYDHDDQTGIWNAAEMDTPDNSDFIADSILARNSELAVVDDNSSAHHDFNDRGWQRSFEDPAQRRTHENGIAAARLALNHTVEK